MTGRFTASKQVAIVGYAQSAIERHATSPLGVLAVETARAAIADAGLAVDQIDGFVTASLFPSAGAHLPEDGVSLVSANWLAEHLGLSPRYAAGFQGFGQIPGSVSIAVNAVASGAADYVLVHRAARTIPEGCITRTRYRRCEGIASGPSPRGTSAPWP